MGRKKVIKELNKSIVPASLTVFSVVIILILTCWLVDQINSQKWKSRIKAKLSDLRLKTGDIVLFNGKSFAPLPTISFVIKLVTNSDISHVGIIWVDPITGQAWVWHTSGVPKSWKTAYPKDPNRNMYAHIVKIEEVLSPKYGKIYIRQCSHELSSSLMSEFIRKHLGREYSLDIALHWYERHVGLVPLNFLEDDRGRSGEMQCLDRAKWSCGELMVHCLVHLGVMSVDELDIAHSYLPNDFSSTNHLRLISGILYSREICVTLK